ncbi:MAG: DUF5009 domain-containing protein [Planctomycetaceae bacterium]|nr:DUF5009 domain-containing protein [Planctomycetaceae bacterium]
MSHERVSSEQRHRVVALDAMRGFALMGSAIEVAFPPAVRTLPPSPARDFTLSVITHSDWHGYSFVDLGFPAYIMMIGMSMTFSFGRRREQGMSRRDLFVHILTRAVLLFIFATIYHGGLSTPFSEIRLTRIFHRLAIAILLCGVFELVFNMKTRIAALVTVLIGYWALMEFYPVPKYGPGDYSALGNINHFIDRTLLGAETYFILSTLGVAGTCLFGLLIGDLFVKQKSTQKRLLWLVAMGVVQVNLGYALNSICPINKHIWTPTFVLISNGWASLVFAGFYAVTDVCNWKKVMFPFTVLGENPLVSFAAFGILPFNRYANLFAGEALTPYLGAAQPLVQATVQVLLLWLLVYWLHRNKLIIRI